MTSRDHAPPKCIFPDEARYRQNLITVPSCSEHNQLKTGDDEYLRHLLVSSPGTNNMQMKVVEKVMRSWQKRPHLLRTFMPDLQQVRFPGLTTAAFTADVPRFEKAIRAIVRALYFHDMQEKLLCDLQVAWGNFVDRNFQASETFHAIRQGEQMLPQLNRGNNPEVFCYGWHFPIANNRSEGLCRLSFYQGHPIWVAWGRELGASA